MKQKQSEALALTLLLPKGSINFANQLLCAEIHSAKHDSIILDILVRTVSIVQSNIETLKKCAVLIHVGFQEGETRITERFVTLPREKGTDSFCVFDTRFLLVEQENM